MASKANRPDSLKQCGQILHTLINDTDSSPFCTAVDWKAWKLFDYPDVIKTPMDLGTIQKNLEAGKYKDALEFAHHVRLVWSNCKTYNQDGSEYYKLAQKFSKKFELMYKKIDLSADLGEIKEPTKEEKKKFSQNIYLIDSEVLGNVVTMLDERCEKCIDKTDPDEIEINIDKIDALTFQAVDEFVKEHLSKQKKASSSSKSRKKRKRA